MKAKHVMKLTKLLGIEHPIVQAPMAGSDNPTLVAAASNAGILGSLGAQYKTPAEISSAIKEIRSLTDKPFAVNLFALNSVTVPSVERIEAARQQLHSYYTKFGIAPPSIESVSKQIDAEEQLQTVLDARVPVFSFTLGIPAAKWIDAFKHMGTILIGTATNLKECAALQTAGVHAICAQGSEAGGHRGTFIGNYQNSMIGLFSLIPQIVDTVTLPVIAAGGIMDGRGIAAALVLGAAGAQMGTAFLTVKECPVHENYKSAIREHNADQTTITSVFSGGAARGLMNRFIEENANKEPLPFPFHNSLTKPFRKVANDTGAIDYTNLWSGQSGKLARELSTQELVDALVKETKQALANSQDDGWN
jgi:nitronate monooxygenase